MINVHIIPTRCDTAPVALKGAFAMHVSEHDTMLIGSIPTQSARVARGCFKQITSRVNQIAWYRSANVFGSTIPPYPHVVHLAQAQARASCWVPASSNTTRLQLATNQSS